METIPDTEVSPSGPGEDMAAEDEIVRDTEIWFDDGSIVLLAGKTAFKVYHGILSAHSVVLADMFSFSQPESAPNLDGCPLLYLSDNPVNLRHLLQELFPRPTIAAISITFHHVSAVIRLAHKYQFEYLLKQHHQEKPHSIIIFPDDLDLLTDFYTPVHAHWIKPDSDSTTSALYIKPADAIDVVYLAGLTGTDILLPLAYLHCATLGSKVVRGYVREDKTRTCLTQAALERVVRGRESLLMQDIIHGAKLGSLLAQVGAIEGCISSAECRKSSTTFWAERMNHTLGEGADPLVLRPWRDVVYMSMSPCDVCRAAISRKDPLGRACESTWRNLPHMFGLKVPAWEDAQKCDMK
ncbi:hypothetical protein C8Q74DRAFT_1211338 [Fomes fomentarius]|nr:hypothetical protein C8Q74DRAFT_1211338 [Fomes fomentarius]